MKWLLHIQYQRGFWPYVLLTWPSHQQKKLSVWTNVFRYNVLSCAHYQQIRKTSNPYFSALHMHCICQVKCGTREKKNYLGINKIGYERFHGYMPPNLAQSLAVRISELLRFKFSLLFTYHRHHHPAATFPILR